MAAEVDEAYKPSDDESFMNERQLAYFKGKLMDWKDDILRESKGTVVNLKAETENHPDLVDRASSESDRALELRTRDRQRKLISKIDAALRRIDEGEYGYCEVTGEPISLVDVRNPLLNLSATALDHPASTHLLFETPAHQGAHLPPYSARVTLSPVGEHP